MNNVRRFMSGLLAICLLAALFGCTNSQDSNNSNGTLFSGELEQNVTIKVFENDTARSRGYLDELLAAFNEAYAEYGIVAVDANMGLYTDLEQDGPYGYGPDIVYGANDTLMSYVSGKHILPLPVESLDCYEQVSDKAWQALRAEVDGETYTFGVPVNVQGPLLFYRKDMLPENWETEWDYDQNGVPDMIESWSAMYRYSMQIKNEGNGCFGYMKSFFDSYFAVGYLYSYGGYTFGNNNTDPSDIGHSAGNAELGVNVIRQLASAMDERCIDDTLGSTIYAGLASGEFFATMITPDVYTMFTDEMVSAGMSYDEAVENLGIADVPMLPVSGDLTDENAELFSATMMGGVNGYAISSYTKYPNACLAFIDFATSYEMNNLRNEMLGIVSARADVARNSGELAEIINRNFSEGRIIPMPSIREVTQIWTPLCTFFQDVAKDPYRDENAMKYKSLEDMKEGLEKVDSQIYDAIHTLK